MSQDDRAQTIGDLGEFPLIERIRGFLAGTAPPVGVILGIGDDAALLRPEPGWDYAVTCDVQINGRHFVRAWTDMRGIGRRAMNVNLSDLAAMGAEPRYALVSLGLDPDLTLGDLEDLYGGFEDALAGTEAGIIGGNISATGPDWFCDITLIGRVEAGQALTRTGARPGDRILVTGSPGRSAAGLALLQRTAGAAVPEAHPWAATLVDAFLRPIARVGVGRLLVSINRGDLPAGFNNRSHDEPSKAAGTETPRPGEAMTLPVTAAIDLSDGLFGDLTRLCEASGVRAALDVSRLPADPALEEAAALIGRGRWEWTLSPGDDYELLMTVAPAAAKRLADLVRRECGVAVTDIGMIAAPPDGRSPTPAAGLIELVGLPPGAAAPSGWDHLRPPS